MENRYMTLALELSEGKLLVCKEDAVDGTAVKVHGPLGIPSDPHGFDCNLLIDLVQQCFADGKVAVIVSLADEFDYCREDNCTARRFCRRFPKGTKFISLQPFNQAVI